MLRGEFFAVDHYVGKWTTKCLRTDERANNHPNSRGSLTSLYIGRVATLVMSMKGLLLQISIHFGGQDRKCVIG
jgi:hypothetical protein